MKGVPVFPAHAGVILRYQINALTQESFSRTRGGDPEKFFQN